MERDFDPITMQYRDPIRESVAKQSQEQKEMMRTQNSQEKLRQSFNIVSHTGPSKPRPLTTSNITLNNPRKVRDRNIVTHLVTEDQKVAPTLYDENYVHSRTKLTREFTPKNKNREFNVISNKFYEGNSARQVEEIGNLKSHLLKKYWQTHDFDFIRGEYYDPNKEERFASQRKYLQSIHGTASRANLPIRYTLLCSVV